MARRVTRGDVWLYRFAKPDKRRPVLVISRQEAIDALSTVMVAPVTSTRHGIETEVDLDALVGLKTACAANFDHVHTVAKKDLRRYVTTVPETILRRACRALAIASGCADGSS